MKICELMALMPEHVLPNEIDTDRQLKPTLNPSEAEESSLLFIYRRLNGGYSVSPDDIKSPPYAIVSDDGFSLPSGIPIIRTENVRKSISYAFYIESGFNPLETKLVGITGTNGKTSTSTIVHRVLNRLGIKCGHIGTGILKCGDESLSAENYSMTTPDADMLFRQMKKMQDRGCRVIVMEVSSHSIALEKIAPLIFDIAIFTNLSSEHLDFHRNMDDYYKTKLRLFEQTDVGIFNIDDEYARRGFGEAKCKKRSFGILERGDIYCTDIEYFGLDGSEFYYRDMKRIFKISTRLPGSFNIYNTALAMSILIELGIPVSRARAEIAQIGTIPGRLEMIHRDPTVIIDYAHTPFAMENVLKVIVSQLIPRQRLLVVFGCGGDRDKSKRSVMGKVASKYAHKIYLTEDNSRTEDTKAIINDILAGIEKHNNVTVIYSRRDAIIRALSDAEKNDVVAIIGKGHERYIIGKDGYQSFSEPEIIKSFYEVEKNEN